MSDTRIYLNDPEVFIDYFEDIAQNTKALRHSESEPHYYPADIFELADAFKVKLQSPAMVSMCTSSGILDGGSHIQEIVTGVLWIIAKQSKADENGKRQVLADTKEIVYQVLAKMNKDKDDRNLVGFDLSKVSITQVTEVAEGWHGYRVEFDVHIPVTSRISYNSENYNYD